MERGATFFSWSILVFISWSSSNSGLTAVLLLSNRSTSSISVSNVLCQCHLFINWYYEPLRASSIFSRPFLARPLLYNALILLLPLGKARADVQSRSASWYLMTILVNNCLMIKRVTVKLTFLTWGTLELCCSTLPDLPGCRWQRWCSALKYSTVSKCTLWIGHGHWVKSYR